MSDLDFIKDEEILGKNLDKTFALGERQFKGEKLNKFTLGHRIILNQLREDSDSTEFFIWSTLFCRITPREKLIELGWDKQICQVKEKFGGLRFYINEGSDEIYKRIVRAEDDSYKICEVTGDVGELRTDIGWYRTLCEDEYLKIKNKRNG